MSDTGSHSNTQPASLPRTPSTRLGFTLVEMMVVIAIILLILGFALPAASTMWEQRKLIDAQNTVQGMLTTARAKAIQGSGSETGLFFYIDQRGNHRIAPIRQVDASDLIARGILPPGTSAADYTRVLTDVFEITQDRSYFLTSPIRVVPRYMVKNNNNSPALSNFGLFSNAELASNQFYTPTAGFDPSQRHRNFFTMIFSTRGHLLVERNVLILDLDEDQNNLGDLTDLRVGYDHAIESANVFKFYPQNSATAVPIGVGQEAAPFLLVDDIESPIAINFPSVDGLMVYDDVGFNDAGDEQEKREMLSRTAQPMYVNRWTGNVILGPLGENTTPGANATP